jgi:hypothetical protein
MYNKGINEKNDIDNNPSTNLSGIPKIVNYVPINIVTSEIKTKIESNPKIKEIIILN